MNAMRPRRCTSPALIVPLQCAVVVMLCLILLASPAAAQRLYRWVDDQGNVHYTDSIPPSQVEKAHVEMSDDGLRVREVPRAKTLDEIERERELARLRAQQARLIEEQRAADNVLIRTFRSVDDLIMARDGKLAAIDVQIQIAKGNVRRQQNWLKNLRAQAADMEKAGRAVDEKLIAGIATTERSIQDTLEAILKREQQKREVRADFDRDLNRFRQLRNLRATQREEEMVAAKMSLDNIVQCERSDECEQLWRRAIDYLQRHATVAVETVGDDVVMTAAPEKQADIALTVSRIWDADGRRATIFLDTQCQNYLAGSNACQTDERDRVLNGFRAEVERYRPEELGMGAGGGSDP